MSTTVLSQFGALGVSARLVEALEKGMCFLELVRRQF